MSIYVQYGIINSVITFWHLQGQIFLTEVLCFSELLPKMNLLASKVNLAGGVKFPTCYFADNDKGVIMMDNLKLQGYVMEDKAKGL